MRGEDHFFNLGRRENGERNITGRRKGTETSVMVNCGVSSGTSSDFLGDGSSLADVLVAGKDSMVIHRTEAARRKVNRRSVISWQVERTVD